MGFNDRGNSYRGGNRGNSGGRGGFRGGNSGPREMTKVTCSDCGVETEVPFKPTEGRPVYCRDCLPNHRKF
jgi:DNA-directed RNA polymerase